MENNKEKNSIWMSLLQLMLPLLMLTLALLSFIGCAGLKEIPVQTVEKVVVRDSIVYVNDTVFVDVPYEKIVEIVPQDTISILRTSIALSEAKVKNGTLSHSLEQNGTIPVQIDTHYVVQYVEKIKEVEKPVITEVEKPYIPTFFWIVLIYAVILTLLVAFLVYLRFIR